MSNSGYVYALINPSMPGLVKVGRTARDPKDRAQELSSTTGVPTEFTVVYSCFFADMTEAEAYVHTSLERKGYRLSDNREFFDADVSDVINAIISAPGKTTERGTVSDETEDDLDSLPSVSDELDEFVLSNYEAPSEGDKIFDEANAYYTGDEDSLQDYREALRLFNQAAKLGSIDAYELLGDMYENGLGVREDKQRALEYYKTGTRKGNFICYSKMGQLFLNQWANTGQMDETLKSNAFKCWDRFFHDAALNPDMQFRSGASMYSCIALYINFCLLSNLPVKKYALMSERKEQIMDFILIAMAHSDDESSIWEPIANWMEENL